MKTLTLPAALVLALASSGGLAAEWTQTLDLISEQPQTRTLEGSLGASAEALWIGSDFALDPATGATLSPWALPERIVADYRESTSSRRGRLWRVDRGPLQPLPLQQDGEGNLWGHDYGTARLIRLAPDGAQETRLGAVDLGYPGFALRDAGPRHGAGGALALLVATDGAEQQARVLRLDAQVRVLAELAAPACTRWTIDDRQGGFYAFCPDDGTTPRSLQRIGATPEQTWDMAVEIDQPTAFEVLESGGMLFGELSNEGGETRWRHFDAQGEERFALLAKLGAASADGFWFWSESDSQLRHLGPDGNERARTLVPEAFHLTVHRSGSALVEHRDPVSGFPFRATLLYSRSADLVRRFHGQIETGRPDSRLGSVHAHAVVELPGDPERLSLINAAGEPDSFALPRRFGGFQSLSGLVADAQLLCGEYVDTLVLPYLVLRCFDRSSGEAAFPALSLGSLGRVAHLGSTLVVKLGHELAFFSRTGGSLARHALPQDSAVAVRGELGAVVLDRGDAPRLRRFRVDGSLQFELDWPHDADDAQVAVGADGSTVVLGGSPSRLLRRLDDTGTLIAETSLDTASNGFDALALEASAAGVQVLLRKRSASANRRGRLLLFDAQLGTLATQELPAAAMEPMDGTIPDGNGAGHTLWPGSGGDPWVASLTPAGLVLQRFDADDGARRARHVLALGDYRVHHGKPRFSVSPEGEIELLDRDPGSGRFVLRRFASAAQPAALPLDQPVLAAAWYTPAATGQGLLLDLLNEGRDLFAAWHTYAAGNGNTLSAQRWLTVGGPVGDAAGSIVLPVYRNRDGRFDVTERTEGEVVGSAELVFTGCDALEFWYELDGEIGALPLQRLIPRTASCFDGTQTLPPQDAKGAIDLDAPWYDPARSGQGLIVSTSGTHFGVFMAGWFTYDVENAVDDDDAQHWFTLQGTLPTAYGEAAPATIFRTIGGSSAGDATRNTHPVGQALLTVHNCASATLEYVFDDTPVAGPFANRNRSMDLQRLDACVD